MRSSIAPGLRRPAALRALCRTLAAALFCGFGTLPGAGAQVPPLPFEAQPVPPMSDPRAADTALQQAKRLAEENRPDDALAAIELALQDSPSDARLRFLKGVLLSGQGKDVEAIEVFRGLAQQFPELPEPHNNLAALHAARGELDLARAALDEAVRALPSYALAHENLGDLHLQLALRAGQRAADLAPGSPAAGKLTLARELSQRLADAQKARLPGSR